MLQGRRDFAFDANQAIAAYQRVRGPKRLYIGDFGHTPREPAGGVQLRALELRRGSTASSKGSRTGSTSAAVELAPGPWRQPTASFKTLPKTRTLKFEFNGRST
jgi:hypothetical protein